MPEEQKQRILLQYARRSFSSTCLLALQLIVLVIGIAGMFWLLTKLFSIETTVIHDASFLTTTTIASVVYALLRKRFV